MTEFALKTRVTVHYTGSLATGEVFDDTTGREPLTYVEGAHEVIPGFELAVLGMQPGERKRVEIAPEQAYGKSDPHLLYTMPTIEIPRYEELIPGQMIYLMNGEGYQQLARVIKVEDDGQTIFDFNHPLAGQTLVFDLELLAREPIDGGSRWAP